MNEMLSKYSEAAELYESGASITDLAKRYDTNTGGMYGVLKRRGVKFRPMKRFGKENNLFRGTKDDDYAQGVVDYAVRKGRMVRQTMCQECGVIPPPIKNGASGIQAHHCDYNKPLDVTWLCKRCHYLWHKHNTPSPRTTYQKDTSRHVLLTFNGKTRNIKQWSRELGMSVGTLRTRLLRCHWPLEKALTAPVAKKRLCLNMASSKKREPRREPPPIAPSVECS